LKSQVFSRNHAAGRANPDKPAILFRCPEAKMDIAKMSGGPGPDTAEKTANQTGLCGFLTFFRVNHPKKFIFFRFFFVFRFLFPLLVLSLPLGFLPFGRNVHISLLEFAVKTKAAHRNKTPPTTTAALRIDLGNMSWNMDKSRPTGSRDASLAVRIRRCRI
jgi:hypothetical protein